MADQHRVQVSDVAVLHVNDNHSTQFPPLAKTLKNKGLIYSSPVKFDTINVEDMQLSDFTKTQMEISVDNVVIELKDDDFCGDDCVFVKKERFLTPRGKTYQDPICVDEYVKVPKSEKKRSVDDVKVVHCVDLDDYDDCDEVEVIDVMPFLRRKSDFCGISTVEVGESSGSKRMGNYDMVIDIEELPEEVMFVCEICADSKPKKDAFKIKGCSHSYCSDCTKSYVASKLLDGVSKIDCPVPGCNGFLEPEYCQEILPFEVFDRWGTLLCESVILASQKFYCPFKDCSALLIDDGDESVTAAECPTCNRLFCAQCKVAWHDGFQCTEFQALGEDERQKEDLMLKKLAGKKKWQRCPQCKFFVEKSDGCLFMKCRCGIAFCYGCGAINNDHRYHYCAKCGR